MEEMVELVATLQEYHYLITYGDYLSILVKQLKAAVPPATIPEMEKKSVCEIAGQVRREMRGYRAWIGAGEKQPAPKVFMLRNIDAAANQMKIFGHDVIFMMQTHAERNDHGALKGQQDRDNLANIIPQPRRKRDFDAINYALERVERIYFTFFDKEDISIFEPTPKAEVARRARIQQAKQNENDRGRKTAEMAVTGGGAQDGPDLYLYWLVLIHGALLGRWTGRPGIEYIEDNY